MPAGGSITVKVLSGTAEKDGVELPLRNSYTFSGIKSKILTWHGCELEVEGRCDRDSVAEYPNPVANPATSHINLHARLSDMRVDATRQRREGPRVLVVGPPTSGKTTLVKTLTSYATRQGYQVITVNADPREGMLSLAGTLSASVFATVMDPEAVDGWGSTPTSGPSTVPVKLPMVFHYGREAPEEDEDFYRELVARLAGAVSGRLSEDEEVRGSGVIVDSTGISEGSQLGMDLVAHIVDEFSSQLFTFTADVVTTCANWCPQSTSWWSLDRPRSMRISPPGLRAKRRVSGSRYRSLRWTSRMAWLRGTRRFCSTTERL